MVVQSSRYQVAILVGALLLVMGVVSPTMFASHSEALLAELRETPGVTVSEYSVVGDTPQKVRAELDARGPKDEAGKPRDAFTKWNISWRWPRENGKPDFAKPIVEHRVEITVPRWEGVLRASPEVRAQWNAYLSALLSHERQHLTIIKSNVGAVSEAVTSAYRKNPSLTAEEATRAASEVIAKIRALDRQYDEATKHGQTEGVKFP